MYYVPKQTWIYRICVLHSTGPQFSILMPKMWVWQNNSNFHSWHKIYSVKVIALLLQLLMSCVQLLSHKRRDLQFEKHFIAKFFLLLKCLRQDCWWKVFHWKIFFRISHSNSGIISCKPTHALLNYGDFM